MRLPLLHSYRFTAGVLLASAAIAGCGSSSTSTSQTSQGTSTGQRSEAARHLERALRRAGPPRPTFASCRPATVLERRAGPFGRTSLPMFTCALGFAGSRPTFDVQVQRNGCFVAERRRPGQAVYGCGAG